MGRLIAAIFGPEEEIEEDEGNDEDRREKTTIKEVRTTLMLLGVMSVRIR